MIDNRTTTHVLDAIELDALTELVNIGVGRAAASLSELVGSRVELNVPVVQLLSDSNADSWHVGMCHHDSTLIVQQFEGHVSGKATLLFDCDSSIQLSHMLAGRSQRPTSLDVEMASVLLEVGNILLNSLLGTFANCMQTNFTYRVPTLSTGAQLSAELLRPLLPSTDLGDLLLADVEFCIAEHQVRGAIAIVFQLGAVTHILQTMHATSN